MDGTNESRGLGHLAPLVIEGLTHADHCHPPPRHAPVIAVGEKIRVLCLSAKRRDFCLRFRKTKRKQLRSIGFFKIYEKLKETIGI